MSERIWDKFLTDRDKAAFAASGYGIRAGYGKRPVLLVIDVNYNFTGDRPEPILDSIARWPASCGQDAWDAVPVIRALIDAAGRKGCPSFTRPEMCAPTDGTSEAGAGRTAARENRRTPRATSTVMRSSTRSPRRRRTSSSANSSRAGLQDEPGIVPDALGRRFSHRDGNDHERLRTRDGARCVQQQLPLAVVEDACFDRSQTSHAINLCDMNAKYADVVTSGVMRSPTLLRSTTGCSSFRPGRRLSNSSRGR